jgi:hypothetical protein
MTISGLVGNFYVLGGRWIIAVIASPFDWQLFGAEPVERLRRDRDANKTNVRSFNQNRGDVKASETGRKPAWLSQLAQQMDRACGGRLEHTPGTPPSGQLFLGFRA